MNKKLHSALKQQKKKTEQTKLQILGTLGIPLGGSRLVEVPNRNSFVYVQLRSNQNEVIQAFNNKVAPSYGLPVMVQREGTRYTIIGVDTQRYQNNWNSFAPYLPRHGNTHSFDTESGGAGDITWVYSKQFMPLLPVPSGSNGGPNVVISPHTLESISGTWMYVGNTGTQTLLQYVPTGSNAVMVLVYLDRLSGNPYILVNSGSYFSNALTGTSEIVPYIPAVQNPYTDIPLGAIRLVTGTNSIGWNNIYDVRQYLQYVSSGSAGGGGGGSSVDTIGFAGLYNGTPIGTGTFLNVRGDNAVFTKSGSMFDLFITGSTGGGQSSPFTGIPVYKDGVFVATGTVIDFEENLYVGATGTTIFVRSPITTYFRVGQPTPLSNPTGLYWKVPDGVYASGSLGVFVNGHALVPGVDFIEWLWVSGIYQYLVAQETGTYHLNHYGVPCSPQTQPPTGTPPVDMTYWLTDSDGELLTDSDGEQLTDSEG